MTRVLLVNINGSSAEYSRVLKVKLIKGILNIWVSDTIQPLQFEMKYITELIIL